MCIEAFESRDEMRLARMLDFRPQVRQLPETMGGG